MDRDRIGPSAALIENYKEPAEKMGWVLVGCNGPKNGQELAIGSKMVAVMLPEIEKAVPFHDPKKFFATGISGGATRAFQTVGEHDRPWKGVISLGGWLGKDPSSITFPKKMSVAWVNGDKDAGANSYVGGIVNWCPKRVENPICSRFREGMSSGQAMCSKKR